MAITPLAIKYVDSICPAPLPNHSHCQVCNPNLLCVAYCNQRLDVGTAWEWDECSQSAQLAELCTQQWRRKRYEIGGAEGLAHCQR